MSDELTSDEQTAAVEWVKEKISRTGEDLEPIFYGVSGSYLYGTATDVSDLDIRGFHCAPGVQYMLLTEPETRISSQHPSHRFGKKLDFVSYEIREFAQSITKGDFTAIEPLYADIRLDERLPQYLDRLQTLLQDHKFPGLRTRYLGMARTLRNRYKPNKGEDASVVPKQCLYALRGALAAKHVDQHGTVEPNLRTLANRLLDESDVTAVEQLISANGHSNTLQYGDDPLSQIDAVIEEGLRKIPESKPSSERRKELETDICEWMLQVRRVTGTR